MTEYTSMEMDDEAQYDAMPIESKKPRFPYGLRICLTEDELKKLGLRGDCDLGHVLEFSACAEVSYL